MHPAYGYIYGSTNSSGLQPYQTNYELNNADFSNYLGTTYKDIILPSGSNTAYWIASRDVETRSYMCLFGVRNVERGCLEDEYMLHSNVGWQGNVNHGLFPVVSLKSSQISGNNADGFSVN